VSVDLGDAGHALRTAAAVKLAALPAARQARMLIDVARAHALRGQVAEATQALLQAAERGPWQPRERERACQVVSDLLAACDPAPSDLVSLASQIGVPR
jgi:hypothetical protein